ncbi:MAG: hypothetical protein K8S25_15800 [Alphaproteobacteria bacterium]|nr:hypothetical protein [Alphaproteobacteria bacterium]
MFFLLRMLFRLLSLTLLVAPVALPLLMIQRTPLVEENQQATFDDVTRAKDILKRFDPRLMDSTTTTKVSVTDAEISMAIGAALERLAPVKGRVDASADGVALRGTAQLPIPDTFLGRYINIEAVVAPSDSELEISSLSIGNLPIPAWIIKPVTIFTLDWFMGAGKGAPAYASVHSVAVAGDVITVAFQPPPTLFADIKTAARRATQVENVDSIRAYYANLIDTGRSGENSLAPYLRNAFALAKTRSQTRDPVEENRALILALALQFGDSHFSLLLGGVETPELAAAGIDGNDVTVQNRHDWVQHMTTSAGLQIAASSGISDFIGVAKEIKDSQTSSGFSFGDLAADRTGVRLAEVATASDASARRIQSIFAGLADEKQFFPKADDLPEDLTEAEFKARFGDIDTPEYTAQVQTIDQRIAKIAVYKQH